MESRQNARAPSPTKTSKPSLPMTMAPTASTTIGIHMVFGASWTWAMTFSSALGAPWKVIRMSRQE